MSLAARSLPNPADPLPSSQPSKTSLSPLQSLELIVGRAHDLSRSWKAMNAGDDSLSWRTRWKGARSSLVSLRELSEP